MSKRKTGWLVAALLLAAASLVAAGCGSSKKSSTSTSGGAATTGGSAKGSVAVLLPDTQSSVRWEQFDRKYLDQAIAHRDAIFVSCQQIPR